MNSVNFMEIETTDLTQRVPRVVKRQEDGLETTILEVGDVREIHLTARPRPKEAAGETVSRLMDEVRAHRASVVRQEIFGSLDLHDEVRRAAGVGGEDGAWPIMHVEGAGCGEAPLAGMHVLAVAGVPVETIRLGSQPVGRAYADPWSRHVVLGNIVPEETDRPPAFQARRMFERLEAALRAAGLDMGHVARTWLFLDDILSWYGAFNAVRTEFFQERFVFERMVPASTGISGRNPAGAALMAAAWAVEPRHGACRLTELSSPHQCAATRYGSSFSRAVEHAVPGARRLWVSGTASIAPDGRSVRPGDMAGQIDLTMEVIEAILQSRGMGFEDASRVTAYFKDGSQTSPFRAWLDRRGLDGWPLVCTRADVCRDELLFEVELDALRAG